MGVVYLVWLPYGIEHFKAFIDSYLKHDAAYPHRLIIVFNGLAIPHPNKPEEYLSFLESKSIVHEECFYFQSGQDIDIYQKVASALRTNFVLFFNSYSEIQANTWLKHYVENFNEKTGVIGASASCQSYLSSVFQKHKFSWESEKGFLYNFRKYKLFIKAFFYWRVLFKPFPNPNIRTNAFMVRREDFLQITRNPIDTKFKAYQFESGRKSMTEFYLKRGMKALVLDKFGRTYELASWKDSSTFWINNQENLLVTDNQTRIYSEASNPEKKTMTWLAWGIK